MAKKKEKESPWKYVNGRWVYFLDGKPLSMQETINYHITGKTKQNPLTVVGGQLLDALTDVTLLPFGSNLTDDEGNRLSAIQARRVNRDIRWKEQKEKEKAEKLAELQVLYPNLTEDNLIWNDKLSEWNIVNVKGNTGQVSSNATINEVDTSISSDEIVPPTTDTNRAALTTGNILPNQTTLSQADIEAGRGPETKGLTITDQQKIKLDEQVQSTREALTPYDISIGRNVPEKEALSKVATTPPNFLKKWDHSQYWGEGFSQKNANQRDADILADLLTIGGKKPKVTNNELMIAAENMRIRGKDSLIFEGSKGRFLKIGKKRINLEGTGL